MMRDTLICTTGTSLIEGNLRRLSQVSSGRPSNWQALDDALQQGNWPLLARELLKIDPSDRLCGAEINTVEQARNRAQLHLKRIYFLVSDTDMGRNTGMLFKKYFEGRTDLDLTEVDFKVVEGLQDTDTARFRTEGLRNLIRSIGDIIGKHGRASVAMDATGGYKAQIAFAVLIGQAIDIPVFYKHERFAEIIDFPPMPISLDYDILGRNADLFSLLEKGHTLESNSSSEFDDKIRVFLTEVSDGKDTLFELNPIGQLYLTSYRLRYPSAVDLKPLPETERSEPRYPPHHMAKGLEEYVLKVWRENKWIKSCLSIEYSNPRAIKGKKAFYVKQTVKESYVVGTYLDHDLHPGQFRIYLSNESRESQNWAASRLNEIYGE